MTCPPHHWLCGEPKKGVTHGVCKLCQAERDFVAEDSKVWEPNPYTYEARAASEADLRAQLPMYQP